MYCMSAINTDNETQELIDVDSISAYTFTVSGTPVESGIAVTNESTGVYYADLNPILYAADVVYELNWYVGYIPGAPIKRLPTRFRIGSTVVGNEIFVEILDNSIEIEIADNSINTELL